MCAALAHGRQGHHPGGSTEEALRLAQTIGSDGRAPGRREELRPDPGIPPRQQPARDDGSRRARQDPHRDHHQRHQGAAGLPGRRGGVSRARGQPRRGGGESARGAGSGRRRAHRVRRPRRRVLAGRRLLRGAAGRRHARRNEARRGLNDAAIASLDLVRRYGDRWERPLALQPRRPRADPAGLPRGRARRGAARCLPRAGALPRAPGDARRRCRYEPRFAPPAGRDHRPGRRSLRRADPPAVPAHRTDRALPRARRSGAGLARARSASRCWASAWRSPGSSVSVRWT